MKFEDMGSEEVPTKDVVLEIMSLTRLQEQHDQYEEAKESPTHIFCINYIRMVDIMLCFTAAQRTGDWEQSLTEAANMLTYIVAAGHHNYSHSFPLYLKDEKLEANST